MIDEVKAMALQTFKDQREHLDGLVRHSTFEGSFIKIPLIVDGVVDTVVFRVKDKKFIAIEMTMDNTQSTEAASPFSRTAVLSDETRTEILTLPEDLQ